MKKNLANPLKVLLTILFCFSPKTPHKGNHSKLIKTHRIKNIQKALKTLKNRINPLKEVQVLEESWHNIKMKIDYSNVKDVPKETSDFVEKVVMPMVTKKYSKMLKVKGDGIMAGFNKCEELIITDSYGNDVEADLVIFIKFNNEEDTLASAGPCGFDDDSNRPNFGVIHISQKTMKTTPGYVKRLYETLMHEFGHILTFSPDLYDIFDTKEKVYVKETRKTDAGEIEVYKLIHLRLLRLLESILNVVLCLEFIWKMKGILVLHSFIWKKYIMVMK